MPLHYTRDDYTFRADAQGLSIEPGPRPITLGREELDQLGLQPRDDYRIPHESNNVRPSRGDQPLQGSRGGLDGAGPEAGDGPDRRA